VAAPAAGGAPPPCAEGRPQPEDVCGCLAQLSLEDSAPDSPPTCELETGVGGPGDLAIARVDLDYSESNYYTLAKGPKGWVTIDALGYLYRGGVFGVSGEWETPTITEETVGGHRVVRITTVETHTDSDQGIDEIEQLDTTTVTFCVLGDKPACPLSVPTHVTYERDRIGMMEDEELDAETKAMMTPKLPIHEEQVLDVSVADDGTATVVLKKGKSDSDLKPLLGPHPLW
jgi:hypothetical protein